MSLQTDPSTQTVKSVERVLDLLEALTVAGGRLSIGDLSEQAKIPMPTTHRFLQTLAMRGYVRQLPDRQYSLGYRLVPIGRAANNFVGLNIENILGTLASQLDESVSLTILSSDKAEYVAQAHSKTGIRHVVELGRRVELYSTSHGKALLTLLPQQELDILLKNFDYFPSTTRTITDPAVLRAEISLAKEKGFAVDREESEIGLISVAAAARSPYDTHMSIALTGPLTRMTEEKITKAVPLLQSATELLSARQRESVEALE